MTLLSHVGTAPLEPFFSGWWFCNDFKDEWSADCTANWGQVIDHNPFDLAWELPEHEGGGTDVDAAMWEYRVPYNFDYPTKYVLDVKGLHLITHGGYELRSGADWERTGLKPGYPIAILSAQARLRG